MDPVSVFNALYDTKCLTFDPPTNAESAPYSIDLSRLSLHPWLMKAIVNQTVDKFRKARALAAGTPRSLPGRISSSKSAEQKEAPSKLVASSSEDSDADSHLGDEIETSSTDDCELDKVFDHRDPVICTAPHSALSLAAAIAFKAQLPYLVISDSKTTQLSESLSDNVNQKRRVVIIEDVISDGEKSLERIRDLESQQVKVEHVICLVDCDLNGTNRLEAAGVSVLSLYNMGAVLRILETTGRISNEQYVNIRSWVSENQLKNVMPKLGLITSTNKVAGKVAVTGTTAAVQVAAS